MFVPHGHSPLGLCWPCIGDTDYDNACAICKRTVWVAGAKELLLGSADGGVHGRALARALPSLRLVVHDKLEPTAALPDVEAWRAWRWTHLYG